MENKSINMRGIQGANHRVESPVTNKGRLTTSIAETFRQKKDNSQHHTLQHTAVYQCFTSFKDSRTVFRRVHFRELLMLIENVIIELKDENQLT